MTDPAKSKYDDSPLDPNGQGDDQQPDLGNTDSPELKVAWDTRPSFNDDPKDIIEKSGGEPGGEAAQLDVDKIKIDLNSTRTQVESMLTTSRVLVQAYEDLKAKVLGDKDTIFGQQSMTGGFQDTPGRTYLAPGTYNPPAETHHSAAQWQEPAKKFAEGMNPVQEKALQSIGSTLELLGEYIALVNHSGQVYAYADKQSNFPPPPPTDVYGA